MEASHVLVVEDDETLRRGYARVLGGEHRVTAVGSGDEALRVVDAGGLDAVVSDIEVPGVSGIELLKAVRARNLDLPIVIVTGSPSVQSAQDAVNYGAFSYLTKPVESAALRDVVMRATRMHQMLVLSRRAGELAGRGGAEFSDRAGQDARFENALATLWMAFQPIVSIRDRRVIGYEALMRNEEPTLKAPPDLLALAERLGRLSEIGAVCRERVAQCIADAPPRTDIFVNLHAHDLGDPDLYDEGAPLVPFAKRVVLEITERASLDHLDDVGARMARLRARGYRIAIDDLGAGYSGLTSLPKLEPEVVKLDMSLIRGIDASRTKQQLVRSMVRVCEDLAMLVVTEGVETAEERGALLSLGCDVFQGYLFAKPQRGFVSLEL